MNGRRLKYSILAAGVVLGALALLAWTQDWYSVTLTTGEDVVVPGESAAGGLAALGLSVLALVGALSIAGPVFRIILGVLAVSIGGLVIASGAIAVADPVSAASSAVSEATGLAGSDSLRELVATISPTLWPAATIAVGSLIVILGLAVIVTSRSWGGSPRRFQAVRLENADGEETPADVWDALSEGRDPTSGTR
jgi:hypothetical protein